MFSCKDLDWQNFKILEILDKIEISVNAQQF